MENVILKKYIILFLIFAFGLPLICVVLIKNFNLFQSGMLNFILYGIEAMTPTLAALIVTVILGNAKEIFALFKKCYFYNVKIRYIILAVISPLTVLVITKLTFLIFIHDVPVITGIASKKLIIVLWALVAEEIGWRGFLQEKLYKWCGHIVTPISIGIIWASWHYHFFWLGTMSAPLILFVLGCITDSFGYYWVTIKSRGNIIPASIWHFIGNLCMNIFLISPEYNHDSIIPYLLYIVYSTIMAFGVSIWGVYAEKGKIINTTA